MNGVLGRLRLWQKQAILGMLGMMMGLPPLVIYMRTSNEAISIAAKDLAGVAPTKAVLRVMQLIQQHRGLSADYLGGNESLSAPRQQKQFEADQAIAQATAILGRDIQNPKLLENWRQAVQAWQSMTQIIAQKSIPAGQCFDRHSMVIAGYLEVLDEIANYFSLALDPAANSHQLTMAVLFHLPNLTECMGQAHVRGAFHLAQKSITEEDRAKLSALIDLGKMHYHNMMRALDKVGTVSPAIEASLAGAIRDSADMAKIGFQLIDNEVINPPRLTFDSADFSWIYTGVIDTQFALSDRAMEALSGVLQKRKIKA